MPFFCEVLAPPAHALDSPARAVAGASDDTLLAVLQPSVALALWLRGDPAGFDLSGLRKRGAFRAIVEGAPEAALDALCEQLPDAVPIEFLTDIFRLATVFAALTARETVRLRLEGVTDDACRRFHTDAVGFRLLVTYAGPGTQWIMEKGAAGIEQVPRGAVALFRGRARPGGHALHRSPPLSHRPEALRWRLLLCIDEPEPA